MDSRHIGLSTGMVLAGCGAQAHTGDSILAKGDFMSLNAKTAAMVLGIVFVIVGALGLFVPNPIVGPQGIFLTNPTHDWIHVGSGVVLLLGAYSPLGPGIALRVIGIIYAIVAVLGFIMPGGMLLGMIAMNTADHWLHVVLAIVILYAGFGLADDAKEPATA